MFKGRGGFDLYCFVSSLSAFAIPTLLALYYLPSRWMTASVAVFLSWFQPGRYGSQALLTGNLSNILYAGLLAAGVPGLRKHRWGAFYGVVIVAALMKPPFLAFLFLPLLAGEGQWLQSAGTVLVVLAGDLSQRAIVPQAWHAFQKGVWLRVFVQGDAGFGLLGQFETLRQHVSMLRPFSASWEAGLAILFLAVPMFIVRKKWEGALPERLWPACLVVLAVLSNPRTLDYDANVAAVPAVFLIVEFFLSLPQSSYRSLIIVSFVIVLLGFEAQNPQAATCLLLISSIALTIAKPMIHRWHDLSL